MFESAGPIFPEGYDALAAALPFLGRLECDAAEIVAGEVREIVLTYVVGAAGLADGAWLKITFRFYSDWSLFQTEIPAGADYVSVDLLQRALLTGETPSQRPSIKIRFDQKGHERPYQKALLIDVVDGFLRPGDRIVVRLGDRRHGGPGTRVQTFVDDAFRFRAYLDPIGTSRFAAVPGDITLKILPGPPTRVRVVTPRLVRPETAFPVTLSAEDAWGNACTAGVGTFRLACDDVSHAVETVPGRWAAARATLSLPAGTHTLAATLDQGTEIESPRKHGDTEKKESSSGRPNRTSRLDVSASPWSLSDSLTAIVPLTADASLPVPRALFADLHVHSDNTVGTNSTANNLAYGRDVAGLDVLGYTANDFNITAARWAADVTLCREFTESGRYLCFPGTEWNGNSAAGGDRNVIFFGDAVFPLLDGQSARSFEWNEDTAARSITPQQWPVTRLHETYAANAANILMIPHVGGRRCNLDFFDGRLERLVEVASAWGHFDWFYRDAVARGYRVGVTAAGDEHRGRPGGGAPGVDVFGVRGGLTGMLAHDLTPAAVQQALFGRRTWATTGERVVGLLRCGDAWQGDVAARGPLHYRLLGSAGWEWAAAYTEHGLLWERNLHAEVGYAPHLVRVRWGGARIKDRYRWARWKGTITSDADVAIVGTSGLEHPEETIIQTDSRSVAIRSETYGDADGVVLNVGAIAGRELRLRLTIEAFNKTGSPLTPTPFEACPRVEWDVSGDDLLTGGLLRRELPGCEMFVAVERVATTLPLDLAGPFEPPSGARAVYVVGRQLDDHKVWTSPIFFD